MRRVLDHRRVVADRGETGLPGHRVLVAGVPRERRHQLAGVLVEVGHHRLVERGQPAVLQQVAQRVGGAVGHHDDVEAGVLLGRQRRPDLGVEGHVVADRLGVVDLDAGGLGEVLQREVLAVEHVEVVGPVREVDRVVQLLLGPPGRGADTAGRAGRARGRRGALHAAGGEEGRQAQRAGAGARRGEHLPTGKPRLGKATPEGRVDRGFPTARGGAVLLLHLLLLCPIS